MRTLIKSGVAAFETRGAVTPTVLSTVGPAMRSAVADLIDGLITTSAAAAVLDAGLSLEFGGAASILIPQFDLPSAANASWVGEAQPIPVRALNATAGPTLTPHKLAVITALSREMLEGSNAEALVKNTLTASATLAIDEALFDANAGSSTRPAGLRYNVASLTASTAVDPTSAMFGDIAALAVAVAPVSGNQPIIFVAGPASAMKLRLRSTPDQPFTVYSTAATSMANVIMAIAPPALVSAMGAARIESSRHALVHMDTAPQAVMAAPTRSFYQTDTVGLRLLLDASWALRAPGVAWTSPTNW